MTGDWYLLRIKTAGLLGGVNLEQPFDFTDACATCGAGARPVPPVRADLSRMGRKQIDATAHDGFLIASRQFADAVLASGLTGLRIGPVRGRSARAPHDAFCWLEVLTSWPPLDRGSRVALEDVCPVCRRAGHFDMHPGGTELVYAAPLPDAADFGHTWEYFGTWRPPAGASRPAVGGARYTIVSARAREVLCRFRLRHLTFDPIACPGGPHAEHQGIQHLHR